MKRDITKDKLKKATRKLMLSCTAPEEVTSRAIVKEAGVQLAMINYCFGSREALIFQVFQDISLAGKIFDGELLKIAHDTLPAKERLKKLHFVVLKFLLANEIFSKAITKYVLLNRDLTTDLNSLPLVLEHYGGAKTKQECMLIAYELSSILQLVVYRQESIRQSFGIDLTNDEELKAFIDMQVDLFLQ
ncbi:MAG: TetR/AcrR family transcriptional regulator [Clostridiales bacterium]|nr:TetR/AcrR family transcriptional regulator [Clostridiaceae bacterium]NLX83975.1 TetR/AcrR family transcriptional regulator [Clostridiales bacterium]